MLGTHMTKIHNAAHGCQFSGRKIVLDTNIWVYIDGFYPHKDLARIYSDFYAAAKKKGNEFVVNDYILGELFNLACRIEYDLLYNDDPTKRRFKERRKSPDFADALERVRDTCLNIFDDCIYEPALSATCDPSAFLSEAGIGDADFSDIVIREHCMRQGYVIVSHDADFADCGLDFVTANRNVLKSPK